MKQLEIFFLKSPNLILLTVLFMLVLFAPSSPASMSQKEWRFKVFLDNKEIGTHDFFLSDQQNSKLLRSEASFIYKLMFIKLYEYEHQNTEVWQGDCLARIESETDANGKPYEVVGAMDETGFRVSGSEGEALLPSCVMTFAYWNPDFLQQTRLLNTQNGEYVDIVVMPPEPVELEVRGNKQAALKYVLKAGELELNLWYSLDNEWLALESLTDGRSLRYVLL